MGADIECIGENGTILGFVNVGGGHGRRRAHEIRDGFALTVGRGRGIWRGMNEPAPPILLSLQVCERVILDHFTRQASVIGLIEVIGAVSFPVRHPLLTIFAELTNGHGEQEVRTAIVDVGDEDKAICEQRGKIVFKDVQQIGRYVNPMQGVVFPHGGEYRAQLWCGQMLMGERRFLLREIPRKGGQGNEGLSSQ